MANESVYTQIRLPAGMNDYIQREADRMGIAKIAFLILLLEQGRMLWEAKANLRVEVK